MDILYQTVLLTASLLHLSLKIDFQCFSQNGGFGRLLLYFSLPSENYETLITVHLLNLHTIMRKSRGFFCNIRYAVDYMYI